MRRYACGYAIIVQAFCYLGYVGDKILTIPTDSYAIEDIERSVQKILASDDITINIQPNNNTLRSEIKCSSKVNFQPEDSIGKKLGFTPRILEANKTHTSDLPVAIHNVNALRVECNITTGAYTNGCKVHTIVEVPSHVIYLPIAVKTIHQIQLPIVDQDGD